VYVEDCLEQTLLEAMDSYGLIDSENQINEYVSDNLLVCLDEFSYLRDYDVEYTLPESNVNINEELVSLEVMFPVMIKSGSNEVSFNKFEHSIKTTARVNVDNGVLKKGTIVYLADDDFVVTAQEDTKVTDKNGNNVDAFSFKIIDNNFNGLHNGVVVGQVAYNALPDGITFDPALKVETRIKKSDIPIGYEGQEPKLGWYDESTGLWKTYSSCGYREDDNYYYYCGYVDHFTPVATVVCGKEDGIQYFAMTYVYESPVQPRDDDKKLDWTKDSNNIYLTNIDDLENAHCVFLDELEDHIERKYNIEFDEIYKEHYDTPEKKCKGMLFDWDSDDLFDTKAKFEGNGGTIEPGSCSSETSCYNKCKSKSRSEILDLLEDVEQIGDEDLFDTFVSGDGINDNLDTISCSDSCRCDTDNLVATPRTYGYTRYEDPDLDRLREVNFEDDDPDDVEEYVGGYATFEFEINMNGDNCVDVLSEQVETRLLNPVYLEEDNPGCSQERDENNYELQEGQCGGDVIGEFTEDGFESKDNDDYILGEGISCSVEDTCFWSLNPEREDLGITNELHEGTNKIAVIVKNSEMNADAFASGLFQLKGTGFGEEDCTTTLQERMVYLCNCDESLSSCKWTVYEYNNAGDSVMNPVTAELNCLGLARRKPSLNPGKTELGKSASLCEFNTNYGFDSIAELSYCKKDGSDDQFYLEYEYGDTWGGYCEDGKKICPGRIREQDIGCYCGDIQVVSEGQDGDDKYEYTGDTVYCCNPEAGGYINEEGDCWQVSPISLKPQGSIGSGRDRCGHNQGECMDECSSGRVSIDDLGSCSSSDQGDTCCFKESTELCFKKRNELHVWTAGEIADNPNLRQGYGFFAPSECGPLIDNADDEPDEPREADLDNQCETDSLGELEESGCWCGVKYVESRSTYPYCCENPNDRNNDMSRILNSEGCDEVENGAGHAGVMHGRGTNDQCDRIDENGKLEMDSCYCGVDWVGEDESDMYCCENPADEDNDHSRILNDNDCDNVLLDLGGAEVREEESVGTHVEESRMPNDCFNAGGVFLGYCTDEECNEAHESYNNDPDCENTCCVPNEGYEYLDDPCMGSKGSCKFSCDTGETETYNIKSCGPLKCCLTEEPESICVVYKSEDDCGYLFFEDREDYSPQSGDTIYPVTAEKYCKPDYFVCGEQTGCCYSRIDGTRTETDVSKCADRREDFFILGCDDEAAVEEFNSNRMCCEISATNSDTGETFVYYIANLYEENYGFWSPVPIEKPEDCGEIKLTGGSYSYEFRYDCDCSTPGRCLTETIDIDRIGGGSADEEPEEDTSGETGTGDGAVVEEGEVVGEEEPEESTLPTFPCCVYDFENKKLCYNRIDGVDVADNCPTVYPYSGSSHMTHHNRCPFDKYSCYDFNTKEFLSPDADEVFKEGLCYGDPDWTLINPGLDGKYPAGWKTCGELLGVQFVFTCKSDSDWYINDINNWAVLNKYWWDNYCGLGCVETGDGTAECIKQSSNICLGTLTGVSDIQKDPGHSGVFSINNIVCGKSGTDKNVYAYLCEGGDWKSEYCNHACDEACMQGFENAQSSGSYIQICEVDGKLYECDSLES